MSHTSHSGTSIAGSPTPLYTENWDSIYSQVADTTWVNFTLRQAIPCIAATDHVWFSEGKLSNLCSQEPLSISRTYPRIISKYYIVQAYVNLLFWQILSIAVIVANPAWFSFSTMWYWTSFSVACTSYQGFSMQQSLPLVGFKPMTFYEPYGYSNLAMKRDILPPWGFSLALTTMNFLDQLVRTPAWSTEGSVFKSQWSNLLTQMTANMIRHEKDWVILNLVCWHFALY